MQSTAFFIERLLAFGVQHLHLAPLDVCVARNTLLDLLCLTEPATNALGAGENLPDTPEDILEPLLDAAAEKDLFPKEIPALRINFEARILGALMPRASELATRFADLRDTYGITAATDDFYDFCIRCNYIRTAQISKNIQWTAQSPYGEMEITINLTKPEKDPKTIALERLQPAAGYPKCMLCLENIGYAGRVNFPARQNHRVIPIRLGGHAWYLQYSPYVYYNEHCIVFSGAHTPMTICPETFALLFDFVGQFPHYTCGSNADLPIVGGSILSHTHFQGGRYTFPMQLAETAASFTHPDYPRMTMEILHWPVSTLRVKGTDPALLERFACAFLALWRGYSDPSADVLAFTEENGAQTPHNTLTPIVHYSESEQCLVLDLVPRNNRTTAQYPHGIFHPHAEIHHIKKENIGLIEVMGLAILPARLQPQCALLAQVLTGARPAKEVAAEMPEHAPWLEELVSHYGTAMEEAAATQALQKEIGVKFTTCLEHAGVYKQTPEGLAAFGCFLEALGCEQA